WSGSCGAAAAAPVDGGGRCRAPPRRDYRAGGRKGANETFAQPRRPKRAFSPGQLEAMTTTSDSATAAQANSSASGCAQACITPWLNQNSASTPDQNAALRPPRQAGPASSSGGRANTSSAAAAWRSSWNQAR